MLFLQVKVVFTGKLLNYEEICSLYKNCERLLRVHDPAHLLLHLYLQVNSMHYSAKFHLNEHITPELRDSGGLLTVHA